jgi:hypothetical protein
MGVVQTLLKSRELSKIAFILRKILALLHVESAGASRLSQQSFILPTSSSWTWRRDMEVLYAHYVSTATLNQTSNKDLGFPPI